MTAHLRQRHGNPGEPTAFWERIPRFFLFPCHPAIFGRIAAAAAIPALAFLAPGVISALLLFLLTSLSAWFLVLRQGSRVLIETSLGHLSPDSYSAETGSGLSWLPFAILALFFCSAVAVGVTQGLFGNLPAVTANLVISLLLPAALMVLIHSRSLLAGLNPWRAATLISGIGKPYLLLCVFLFCLSSAQMFLTWQLYALGLKPVIASWVSGHLALDPGQRPFDLLGEIFEQRRLRLASAVFCANLAAMFFTMIAFSMLGYVLYQYRRQLGLPDHTPAWDDDPANALPATRIAALIAAGQLPEAIDIAYEEQRVHHDDVVAQERYHKLLRLARRTDRLLPHASRLIALLLQRQMADRALAALRRCRELDADFRPPEASLEFALAEAAHRQHESRLALELMRAFDKRHPGHPLIPEVYFLSARILCEEFRQDATAEKIFASIIRRYPQHPCASRAEEYRQTLSRLRSVAPAG